MVLATVMEATGSAHQCDILWPEVQSHSDDSPVHATGPRSACALLRLAYNVMHSSSDLV